MDPAAIVSNVVKISLLVIQKVNDAKHLPEDCKTVSRLVRSVESIVRNATDEVNLGRLSQPSVLQALKVNRARDDTRARWL